MADFSSLSGSPFGSSDSEEDVHHRVSRNSNRVDLSEQDDILFCNGVKRLSWFSALVCVYCFVSVFCYNPTNVWIGPNSSILFEPNPIFVRSVQVKKVDDSKYGMELYGFNKSPPLDVMNWSESRFLSVSPRSFKAWSYYLNNGTSFNISYSVISQGSSVQLIVAEHEGVLGISQGELDHPSFQNSALSWNLIHGSGMIELKISKASSYFVAVSNWNAEEMKVELDIDVKAMVYDTTPSIYKCNFSNNGECTFDAVSVFGNSLVLTSSAWRQGESTDDWYISYTYQPRWSTYLLGTGVICFILLTKHLWKWLWCGGDKEDSRKSLRRGLLEDKYDDADLEEAMGNEGKGNRGLCAICYDAPRDCFYFPCGHCVSCYQCGTSVAKATGKCPICRRKMMKVKRIFTT